MGGALDDALGRLGEKQVARGHTDDIHARLDALKRADRERRKAELVALVGDFLGRLDGETPPPWTLGTTRRARRRAVPAWPLTYIEGAGSVGVIPITPDGRVPADDAAWVPVAESPHDLSDDALASLADSMATALLMYRVP